MGVLTKMVLITAMLTVLTAAGLALLWFQLEQSAPVPDLKPTYWGPGEARKDDETIRPFKINVSDEALKNLKNKLKSIPKLTPPLEGVNFWYGFNSEYLTKLADFWLNKYNWKEREAYLNSLPQFTTQVAGLKMHFLHVKPSKVPTGVKVVPLLLLHGWPGSIREFYEIIPLLTTPREGQDFVFEVIAPSLPGYGFSEGASKPGLGSAQIAVVMKSLMDRLGFQQFYIQGGDWGAFVATDLATLYPKNVLGLHSNFCQASSLRNLVKMLLGSFCPSLVVDKAHEHLMYPLGQKVSSLLEESGYFHIQATKPDTIGVALQDSPVGLAAYLLEKFSTGTNATWRALPDGGLADKYSPADLLDNVMIYWISGSITTSMRLYSENVSKEQRKLQMPSVPCVVPTACVMFPNEINYTPEDFLKEKFKNLVRYTHMPRGGHFAAFEEPKLLADDIWESIKTMRSLAS